MSQGVDELVVRPTELEFSVSTQPEQVREFLAHSFAGMKVIFSTYQSADVVARVEFDEVWAVLQALQEQDEVLDDIIQS